jgi:hypothetical protein
LPPDLTQSNAMLMSRCLSDDYRSEGVWAFELPCLHLLLVGGGEENGGDGNARPGKRG